MKVTCPHCNEQIAHAPKLVGKSVMCSACHQLFEMPPAETLRNEPVEFKEVPYAEPPTTQPASLSGTDTISVMLFGVLLFVIGLLGLVGSFNIDTTAEGEHSYSTRVHNVGLIESRRFWSEASGVMVVSGSVLFGCGFLARAVLSSTEDGRK